jgi:hypothetical protein
MITGTTTLSVAGDSASFERLICRTATITVQPMHRWRALICVFRGHTWQRQALHLRMRMPDGAWRRLKSGIAPRACSRCKAIEPFDTELAS